MRRAWGLAAALAALAGLAAGCGSNWACLKEEPVLNPDGTVARCLAPVDCPRPSNVLVCASTGDRVKGCVDCVSTECHLFTVPCQ